MAAAVAAAQDRIKNNSFHYHLNHLFDIGSDIVLAGVNVLRGFLNWVITPPIPESLLKPYDDVGDDYSD